MKERERERERDQQTEVNGKEIKTIHRLEEE